MRHIGRIILFGWFLFACLICSGKTAKQLDSRTPSIVSLAAQQCAILDGNVPFGRIGRTYQDSVILAKLTNWCSGFFPGTCWYCYALGERVSGGKSVPDNDKIKETAIKRTATMLAVDSYYRDHDIGFQIMCSAGLAYKFTGDTTYLSAIRHATELLAARFSPVTGTIKSWDGTKFTHPVIVDNMMNLELLTFAARMFGVPKWEQIARTHANTTMANHFRPDGSCYHLVDYDTTTGTVIKKITVQGYADDSAWARGQSWALYGYTMMYRETGEENYLAQAEKVAAFLLPLLAKKPVPSWDFNAPAETAIYDDASAGAVMASAFIELSELTRNKKASRAYLAQAERTLLALSSSKYLASLGEIGGFILKHSTGHLPANREIDVPLSYADYYYLEALYRYSKIRE